MATFLIPSMVAIVGMPKPPCFFSESIQALLLFPRVGLCLHIMRFKC